ncbi:probable receptor-like protein kinase At1g30570 [Telopea speciosissima]|uniref:probable receptor-like protein kinase At1g30570 n=1 Tax=Telopea speciosissima TaxID=54955 RepID=UPI001CC7AECB|nr:probable receptor-like protein kinase At1g30570 [Telopea speciosissima]
MEKSTLRKLKTGKASISRLASLRRQRKKTCHSPSWSPLLPHETIGNINTFARVSKLLGGFLDPNASTTSDRVGKWFRIKQIRAATTNFDESLVIGVGSFGIVYKGVIDDLTLVAFKRANMLSRSERGLAEFENEIKMLSKLRHRHVVSMIGFCKEENEKILVYEYMANGTLRNHLFGSNLPPLTWKQRLEICIGTASGLDYLHTWAELGILHRDVKRSNILLDENFVAKIADFGVSKTVHSLGHDQVSKMIKGTYGYMAPENMRCGELTKKCDVYSFGVILLEVVCARPNFDGRLPEDEVNLKEWALRWQRQGSLEFIVDQRLEGNYCPKSLKKFVEIAEKCVADEGKNRPTMGEVLQDLKYVLQLHEAWLRNNAGKKSTTSSSVGTIRFNDSRIGIELDLVRYDISIEEEYSSTCFSLVDTVNCDEFPDLVNEPQGR